MAKRASIERGYCLWFLSFFFKFSDWGPCSFICSVISRRYLINIGTIFWVGTETSNWVFSGVVQGALGGDEPWEEGSAWNQISKQGSEHKWRALCGVELEKLAANQLAVYVMNRSYYRFVLGPAAGHCKLSRPEKETKRWSIQAHEE